MTAPTTPERKAPPLTEMTQAGVPDTDRYTDFMRYSLPPLFAHEDVQFDGYGRYKLPSPTTGKLTSYTRATTMAKTISDASGLESWKIREKVNAVMQAKTFSAQLNTEVISTWSDIEFALAAAYLEGSWKPESMTHS